jgi:hypothetical protein
MMGFLLTFDIQMRNKIWSSSLVTIIVSIVRELALAFLSSHRIHAFGFDRFRYKETTNQIFFIET